MSEAARKAAIRKMIEARKAEEAQRAALIDRYAAAAA